MLLLSTKVHIQYNAVSQCTVTDILYVKVFSIHGIKDPWTMVKLIK